MVAVLARARSRSTSSSGSSETRVDHRRPVAQPRRRHARQHPHRAEADDEARALRDHQAAGSRRRRCTAPPGRSPSARAARRSSGQSSVRSKRASMSNSQRRIAFIGGRAACAWRGVRSASPDRRRRGVGVARASRRCASAHRRRCRRRSSPVASGIVLPSSQASKILRAIGAGGARAEAAVLDHHRDRDRRVVRRRVADEQRLVAQVQRQRMRIERCAALAADLLRGAGLAGHQVRRAARDRRARCRRAASSPSCLPAPRAGARGCR